MENLIEIRKKANATTILFEVNQSIVAVLNCTCTLDRQTSQPVLSDWEVQIQAESFSLEKDQKFNDYQKRIEFLNKYCSEIKTQYQDDPDGFIDLVVKEEKAF